MSAVRVEQNHSASKMFHAGSGDSFAAAMDEVYVFMLLLILAVVFVVLLIIGLVVLVYCTYLKSKGSQPHQPFCCCCRKTQQEAITELPPTYFLFPLNPAGGVPEDSVSCPGTQWVVYPGQAPRDPMLQVSACGPAPYFTATI